MIYLCIVIEVIQNRIPERTIVIIPGTHPRTLRYFSFNDKQLPGRMGTHERDHDWAMIARQTCSPASKQAVFRHDIVRNLMSC